MDIREIKYNNEILARHIKTRSLAKGLGFYSNEDEYIQVGTWNYDKGKILVNHIHNRIEREILRTQEVLYIIQGSIKAKIYSLEEVFVEEIIAQKGDVVILLNSGHGYEILENDTHVLEIKNGPYLGAEIDRRRFNG